MIKSMTGFGRVAFSEDFCELKAEMKSVNSKYCDINMRLPRVLAFMEIPLRALIQEKIVRGKIDLSIDIRFYKSPQTPVLNRQNFAAALNVLEQMKELGDIDQDITIDNLLHFQDLIEHEYAELPAELEDVVNKAVVSCIAQVDEMRSLEGRNLEKSMGSLLNSIDIFTDAVRNEERNVFDWWMNRFKARISDMLPESIGSENRLVQEASIYAEKADITEEIDRILSHVKQFHLIMKKEFPCGKKLDFLSQELYRECNTIASKAGNTSIINAVIEAKSAVDSIREQIQNII